MEENKSELFLEGGTPYPDNELDGVAQVIMVDALNEAIKVWQLRANQHSANGLLRLAANRQDLVEDAQKILQRLLHCDRVVLL